MSWHGPPLVPGVTLKPARESRRPGVTDALGEAAHPAAWMPPSYLLLIFRKTVWV